MVSGGEQIDYYHIASTGPSRPYAQQTRLIVQRPVQRWGVAGLFNPPNFSISTGVMLPRVLQVLSDAIQR